MTSEVAPDPSEVELAEALLELTPVERLRALHRFARMRELVREQG
jgi:hypothetical protein